MPRRFSIPMLFLLVFASVQYGRSLARPQDPEQHAGAPVHQVQVIDLTAPAHRVLVVIDGVAYGEETIARADGGGQPEPPEPPDRPEPAPPDKPIPPEIPSAPGPVPAGPMLDAVNVYLRGQAANYVSVGQQVAEGKVTNLTDWEAATKLARDHAANRLEKVLADTWGQAEAVAEDGSFLKPDIVGESTAQVGKTINVILGPPRKP